MRKFYFIFIPLIVNLTNGRGAEGFNICPRGSLKWAPRNLRKPFVTFFNDVDCPSWTTRDTTTKDSRNVGNIILPRGTPFAFGCGACYISSKFYKPNLTLQATGVEVDFKALTVGSERVHSFDKYIDCLVSYGITAPIVRSGKLECKLNRGTNPRIETVHFSVQSAILEQQPLQKIYVTRNNELPLLKCSNATRLGGNDRHNLVYVWHSNLEDNLSQSSAKVVIANLRRNVEYNPWKNFQNISCSTYNTRNPNKVLRTTYEIYDRRAEGDKPTVTEWPSDGKPKEAKQTEAPSGILNTIYWLLGTSAVIIVVGVVISMGFCRRSTFGSSLPQKNLVSKPDNKSKVIDIGRDNHYQLP